MEGEAASSCSPHTMWRFVDFLSILPLYDTTLIVAFWGSFSIVFAVQLMEACGGRLKDILIVAMRLAVAESNWLECVRVLDSTPPSFPSFYRVL